MAEGFDKAPGLTLLKSLSEDALRKLLIRNSETLVDNINLSDGLSLYLMKIEVIEPRQKESLDLPIFTLSQQNEKLLEILPRRGKEKIIQFVEALRDKGHLHIFKAIINEQDEYSRKQLHQSTAKEDNKEDVGDLLEDLCSYYKIHMGHVQRLPSDEDDTMELENIRVKLAWNRTVLTNTGKQIEYLDSYSKAFSIAGKGSHILVEGKPGVGKTTSVKILAIDWVDVVEKKENAVKELECYELLFIITLRLIQENESLVSVIIKQHNLSIKKEHLEKVLKSNDRILLVLDGYDEYSKGTCPDIDAVIERKCFRTLSVLMTSRPWKSTSFATTQRLFEFHFQIEGFRAKEIIEYTFKYFPTNTKARSFLKCIFTNELSDLAKSPVMLLIFCLLYDEEDKVFSSKRSDLYWKLMEWFYLRYTAKRNHSDFSLEEIVAKLGEVACKNLFKKQGQLLFKRNDIEKELGSQVFEIGFLSSEKIRGCTSANILVSFPHKSIQDYVVGYFLSKPPYRFDMLKSETNICICDMVNIASEALTFAIEISDKCLPPALSLCDPIQNNILDDFIIKCKRMVFNEEIKYDDYVSFERALEYFSLIDSQGQFASMRMSNPVVISSKKMSSENTVTSLTPQVVSANTLTAKDIVDEKEIVIAIMKIGQFGFLSHHSGIVILTNSKFITLSFKAFIMGVYSDKVSSEAFSKCVIGFDLESCLVLRLPGSNYSDLDVRTICHKCVDLIALDLSFCNIKHPWSADVLNLVIKNHNLKHLDLSENPDLCWMTIVEGFLSSELIPLRSLMSLKLRGCEIPEGVAGPLGEFIKAQRDMVAIDLSGNPELSSNIGMIFDVNPKTTTDSNWESLILGPVDIKDSKVLGSIVLSSPYLTELELIDCGRNMERGKFKNKAEERSNMTYSFGSAYEVFVLDENFEMSDGEHEHDCFSKQHPAIRRLLLNLHGLKYLKRLSLRNCAICNEDIDFLIENLYKNPNLTRIELIQNPFSERKHQLIRDAHSKISFIFNSTDRLNVLE